MSKMKKNILLLGFCLLTGCTAVEEENHNVYEWIQNTEQYIEESQSVVKESAAVIVGDVQWQLYIDEKQIAISDEQVYQNGNEIYCELDLIRNLEIVNDNIIPTYFVDDNGLRCVGIELDYNSENATLLQKKHYALLDNTLIQFGQDVIEIGQFEVENGMLSLDFLCDTIGWEYSIDLEKCEIQVLTEFSDIKKSFFVPVIPQLMSNHVWLINGEEAQADVLWGEEYKSKFSSTPPDAPIEVKEGERFWVDFYLSWFSDVATILFLDDDGEVVQYCNSNSAKNIEDTTFIVPKGATQMHLSFFTNQYYSVMCEKKYVTACAFEEEQSVYEQERATVMQEQAQNSWKNVNILYDKGYVSFVLDDCRPDMDVVADIFAEYQVPLCVAAVWENVYSAASMGDRTRMEVCEQVVDNGGEILAHDGEVLTVENMMDPNVMEKHFILDKYYFEQCGFDVNGIILAGGAGQVVGSEVSDLWSRNFYRYSDLYGTESKGEPYYHRRYWLANCVDNFEEIISDAISKKEWVSFYFHDLKEVNEEQLREILECVTSASGDLDVVTYKTLYSKIYGVE